MAPIKQAEQPRTEGGSFEETPEQRRAWRTVRQHVEALGLIPEETFTVRGIITRIELDKGAYFSKPVKNDKGVTKDWYFVKVRVLITDERFGGDGKLAGILDFAPKDVGASFFDGRTPKGRSDRRGGLFAIHVAATHQEPSQDLIFGVGEWDTDDYERKPLLLRLIYKGDTTDERYADKRDGMTIFLQGFERDREAGRQAPAEQAPPRQDRPAPASRPEALAEYRAAVNAPAPVERVAPADLAALGEDELEALLAARKAARAAQAAPVAAPVDEEGDAF